MDWLPILLIALAVCFAALLVFRPALPVRWALTLFVRLFYRMRVLGVENVPTEGPALLVCNHVSYIDWLLLVVAQRRVIRFVVFAGWTNTFFIRHLLRWGKVIPIDASSGPRAIVKSLQAAGEALKRGDLVCIFAEGRFTRTGFLLPFRRGFEEIAKRGGAPIIPVCLDELWGSIFSFYGDRCLWKLPRQLPYSVTVAFGKPMPAESNAEQVRLAVQELAADAAIARSDDLLPVHRQFVRTAARRGFGAAILSGENDDRETGRNGDVVEIQRETHGAVFTHFRLLTRGIRLMRQLRGRLAGESVVGIWMPASAEAAIANFAAMCCRTTVVNLNAKWPAETLRAAVEKSGIRVVLVAEQFREAQPLPSLPGVQIIDVDSIDRSTPSWRKALAWAAAFVLPGVVIDRFVMRLGQHSLDDPAVILFAQASDSSLQGFVHTHRSLASVVFSLARTYDLSRRCLVFDEFGFDHCVGLSAALWAPLVIGMNAAYAYSRTPIQPGNTARDALDRRLAIIMNNREQFRVFHPMPGEMVERSADATDTAGPSRFEAFYLPELAAIAATNVPDKTLEGFTQIGNKPGTVGQPLAGMAARVVNPESFEPLAAGQEGLLQFRSASLMKGYLGDEEATRRVLRDGWFSTGDNATIDEHGFITIVERA